MGPCIDVDNQADSTPGPGRGTFVPFDPARGFPNHSVGTSMEERATSRLRIATKLSWVGVTPTPSTGALHVAVILTRGQFTLVPLQDPGQQRRDFHCTPDETRYLYPDM